MWPLVIQLDQVPACSLIQVTMSPQAWELTPGGAEGELDIHRWHVARRAVGSPHIIGPVMCPVRNWLRIQLVIAVHHVSVGVLPVAGR